MSSRSSSGEFGDMFDDGLQPQSAAAAPPVHFTIPRRECGSEARKAWDDPATVVQYPELKLRKHGGHHSLWGHELWNAAKYLTNAIDSGAIDVAGMTVLELGAGLGVPSIVAAQRGARFVCVTDYPDEALLDVIRGNVADNCGLDGLAAHLNSEAARLGRPDESTARRLAEIARRQENGSMELPIAVEPLLWGSRDQIAKVLDHTGGSGYDVVILSDIVFNHVCHRELLATAAACLASERRSVAYVVFSHHRPWKQADDLRFFDLCAEFGLEWKKIAEDDTYPLMFPNDPGPPEVRKPVHCFELRHHFDDAGAPLSPLEEFDCIVQGSGMTESFLSAALAKAGFKTLHLDRNGNYGGAFESLDPASFPPTGSAATDVETFHDTRGAEGSLFTPQNMRRFLLDTVPIAFMANSDTVETLVRSNTARALEFQNVDRLLTLSLGGEGGSLKVARVPLSRADIFKSNLLGPMEMRRLMKFIREMDALLPPLEGDGDEAEAAPAAATEAPEAVDTTQNFFAFARGKYQLSDNVLSMLTLHASLVSHTATVEQGVRTLQKFMHSVGRWGGSTPYLVPLYGCSEIPQNMCRVSAVWNCTFVLRRFVTDAALPYVTLSNGQKIKTKTVVTPRPAASGEQGLVRATVVLREPLITWAMLEAQCADVPEDDDERATRERFPGPLVVGVLPHDIDGATVPIHVMQQTSLTQQTPDGPGAPVIVHFTAAATALPLAALRAVVDRIVDPAKVALAHVFRVVDGVGSSLTCEGSDEGVLFSKGLYSDAILDDAAYVREAEMLFNKVAGIVGKPSMPHARADRAPKFLEEDEPAADDVDVAEGDTDARLLGVKSST